jgi:iron(III) transport system substrate-binding protein
MRAMLLAVLVAILVAACGRSGDREVVVYTSVDQVVSEPVLRDFEKASGIRVRAVFDTEETKSTGVLNRLVAEGDHPQADVFWSGDPVRPYVLVKRGLVERYASPNAAGLPDAFKAADGTWTGFAARARVLLVNKDQLAGAPPPTSVQDLVDPRWKGRAAIANPLFGTTTMHAAAWFAAWGDDAAKAFFAKLRANDVRIASSNGEVKRLVAAGEVVFGLTDTDDAHEALEAKAPVLVVYPDQAGTGTLVMPTAVIVIKGAPHAGTAKQLVDYLVTAPVEEKLAASAAQMPLRTGVAVPDGVRRVGDVKAMSVDYARVADTMERIQPWLREWAGVQ